MKKFLILLMALAIVCGSFVACDGQSDVTTGADETSADGTGADGTDAPGTVETDPETEPEPEYTGTLAVVEDDNTDFGPVNKN